MIILRTPIRRIQLTPIVLALGLVSGSAHAALEGRDLNGSLGSFEAYYDTDLDITWLADANYAKTSGYDADGLMTWDAATTWTANLSFTDGVSVYDNWRLPTALNQDGTGLCVHYNCTGSEMGHLFYNELGGTANQSILTSSDPDLAKFTNLQAVLHDIYWSSTEAEPGTGVSYIFRFYDGNQVATNKPIGLYALAVSPGNVGAVPEAATWVMLLAGLGLVGAATRRWRG